MRGREQCIVIHAGQTISILFSLAFSYPCTEKPGVAEGGPWFPKREEFIPIYYFPRLPGLELFGGKAAQMPDGSVQTIRFLLKK
jgi:hypothetical protein